MWLRMPKGCDSVTHDQQGWTVNPFTQEVEVPDHVANFMLMDGKSGAVLVEDDFDDLTDVRCPHCGYLIHDVLVRKETT